MAVYLNNTRRTLLETEALLTFRMVLTLGLVLVLVLEVPVCERERRPEGTLYIGTHGHLELRKRCLMIRLPDKSLSIRRMT